MAGMADEMTPEEKERRLRFYEIMCSTLPQIAKELKKANKFKAVELYILSVDKMSKEAHKELAKKIEELIAD